MTSKLDYQFVHWITPDMMPTASALVSEHLQESVFAPQQLPKPTREPGDRLVYLSRGSDTKLAVIVVADIGLLRPRRGMMTFKSWVSPENEEKQLAVGKLQIGGIETIASGDVAGIKP